MLRLFVVASLLVACADKREPDKLERSLARLSAAVERFCECSTDRCKDEVRREIKTLGLALALRLRSLLLDSGAGLPPDIATRLKAMGGRARACGYTRSMLPEAPDPTVVVAPDAAAR